MQSPPRQNKLEKAKYAQRRTEQDRKEERKMFFFVILLIPFATLQRALSQLKCADSLPSKSRYR